MTDMSIDKLMEAVTELRSEVEKKSSNVEKINKIEAFLDSQEAKNQALVLEQKKRENEEREMKERFSLLEIEVARAGRSEAKTYRDSIEFKAAEKFVKRGKEALSIEEKAALRTDIDTDGGVLVGTEKDSMLYRKIEETSDMRRLARVRTTSKKTLEIDIRATIPTATYEGEGEEGTESKSSYERVNVTTFRQSFTVPVTLDLLSEDSYDVESELFMDAALALVKNEGAKFVAGTSVKMPEGFTVNAACVANARTSLTSGVVSLNDMIDLTGDLKTGYNPVYLLNRKTLATLRKEQSSAGGYLWAPGVNGSAGNNIAGFNYVIMPDMADVAANSISVAFGDWYLGYQIIDRIGITMIRDEYTKKKFGIVEFTFNRWNTGRVVLSEAIKLLKTKA